MIDTRRLALLAVVVLVATSALAPLAAADHKDDDNSNPTTTTGSHGHTTTSTGSSTSTPAGVEEMMDVVERGPAVSEDRARIVYDWVSANDVSTLSEGQARDLYKWLLQRQATAYVPSSVRDAASYALEPSTAEDLREDYAPETTSTPEPASTTASSQGSTSDASTGSPAAVGNNSTVVERVDGVLVVTGYSYNATTETFTVTLQNTAQAGSGKSSQVTITEVISRRQAGEGTFGVVTGTIEAGSTRTFEVPAKRVSGTAAVMIVSVRSQQQNRGTYLQESSKSQPSGLIGGEPTGAQVRTAGLSGGFTVLTFGFLSMWQYRVRRNEDVKDVNMSRKRTILGWFRRD